MSCWTDRLQAAGAWLTAAVLGCVLTHGAAAAQVEVEAVTCASMSAADRVFCSAVARTAEVVQPQIGASTWAGNPVAGTGSTLGLRLGSVPRISIAARFTAAEVDVPQTRTRSVTTDGALVHSLNVDAAVGLMDGFTLAPTVGGVLSVDAVAGLGFVSLPTDEGFLDDGRALAWGLGLRLGILRESFTLPGVSVTGMYRRLGTASYGDPDTSAGFYEADLESLSLRGAVSKRILTLGFTAGIGYDRYGIGGSFGLRPSSGGGVRTLSLEEADQGRVSYFGSVSWTLLVLHIVGEAGWQEGPDTPDASLPAGALSETGGSTTFGSITLRLSI